MSGGASGRPRAAVLALGVALAVAGGLAFWFVCDDAYIAFRYAAARRAGWGYTWNPPPFPMVEGYTSVAWVVLLDVVWALTGVQPPVAAPALGLGCGVATVLLAARLVARGPGEAGWLALALAFPLTNRTVFAWFTSGLETPLFVLLLVAWAGAAVGRRPGRAAWLGAALALTRPDGLLFWALGLGWALLRAALDRRAPLGLLAALPVLAHLLWRHATYGSWLPNTFRAKVSAPWPEAGLRHLGLFVLEYALFAWVPVLVAAAWAARGRLRGWARDGGAWRGGELLVAVGLGGQLAYYTLKVGGDHFEHRVFVPLLWLGWLGLVGAVRAAGWGLGRGAAVLLGLVVLSWPIPWAHHARTRDVHTRVESWVLVEPVAPLLPAALGPWARAWDDLQSWLIPRQIAVRHAEHRVFGALQALRYPPHGLAGRSMADGGALVVGAGAGGALRPDPRLPVAGALADLPVHADGAAGAGWFLFPLVVIDTLGLNDPVVAAAGFRGAERVHAHELRPPAGYADCFAPNVYAALLLLEPGASPRVAPFTPRHADTLDTRARELPAPDGAAPGAAALPLVLVGERAAPLGPAGVEACLARDWSAAGPAPGAGASVAHLEAAAAAGAAARAARRGEPDR